MSHNLAELPLSRRRALEREKQACLRLHLSRSRASERLERAVREEVGRLLAARERHGDGWSEWVSAELCVADDPLFVRKVATRLRACVEWQRRRAA
ncbi:MULTISPECIES: hypothetical protein [Pseudomonas aeruginosa group]|uniref:Transcriptional regulator n=1 Tax=Pseudomonas paraeruginosa TaxID=2994495 RepID=A0A2R3IUE5_9PSED|nr:MULTISPECIES: hypothetical protein [Pseudomonas aeruginosa group]AVK05554.1 hypothetical protein CSB93_4210 [Pseudomonas paraeruginosa]AWE91882.1 hypothetical protein CSC28_2995 [Pseudomonas paraeruginosa]KSD69191.1 hypothetical protein AO903_20850 [Pseudomonas aeruginosa]MBG5756440.1 hypothetical protein [Pseudomonas aeruginosa]MCT9633803.1 hypothetical protein [Pseudomonas aeruginosa]